VNSDCADDCNDRPLGNHKKRKKTSQKTIFNVRRRLTHALCPADFLFLIDASSSMQVNIDAVRQGMPLFVDQIAEKKTDAQYGVVLFGAVGTEVVLDWTPSATLARDVIKQVIAGNGNNFTREPYNLIHFDHDCKHTNNCGTRESTFEAIRMALGKAKNNTFIRHPRSQTALLSGGITWRMGAERYIFLVTDEDSDCPFYDINRYFDGPTQQCTTPGFVNSDNDGTYQPTKFFTSDAAWPNLPNPWQQEVVDTAKAIYEGRGHVSMFVKPTNGRTRPQFGDPSFAVQVQNTDFSNFSAAGTLALLRSSGLNNSLQALTLALQLNDSAVADDLRIFDTRNITSPNVVDNFFKEVAKTIVNACFGRKRQMANCQLNYCDIDATRQCRSDPRCDAGAKNCDNCKIPDGNTTLCVFDGAANRRTSAKSAASIAARRRGATAATTATTARSTSACSTPPATRTSACTAICARRSAAAARSPTRTATTASASARSTSAIRASSATRSTACR
jgi:hypothetical protein